MTTTIPSTPAVLGCNRAEVTPGERVLVQGNQSTRVLIPADAVPGQRLWLNFEDASIDFTVAPLADLTVDLLGDSLRVSATSHLGEAADFALQGAGKTRQLRLIPHRTTVATLELDPAREESAEVLPIVLRSGQGSQSVEVGLLTLRGFAELVSLPAHWTGGVALRGQKETTEFGTSGATVHRQTIDCGAVEQNRTLHAPTVAGRHWL